MSLSRRLSELKQEIQFLEIEKESRMAGIDLCKAAQDWTRLKDHAANLERIDALLIIKTNQSEKLLIEFAEEQRLAIVEAI